MWFYGYAVFNFNVLKDKNKSCYISLNMKLKTFTAADVISDYKSNEITTNKNIFKLTTLLLKKQNKT